MKLLIAVESCWKDRERHLGIRQTWGKHVSFADLSFFLGNAQAPFSDNELLGDEIWLPVNDDYAHLCEKTHAIISYAYRNGYEGMLKCDTDTFLIGERLEEFIKNNKSDFVGYALPAYYPSEIGTSYPHGGAGYWLSKKAMKVVFNTSVCDFCMVGETLLAEDSAIGRSMALAGIELTNDLRFSGYMKVHPAVTNEVITTHQVPKDQIKAIEQYFYERVPGRMHISRGTLIIPNKRYVVRDGKVYEVDEKGNIIQ
jgi:hypothetical protein